MKKNKKNQASHWTASSTADFLYSIASDFMEQLRAKLIDLKWSQKRLAKELKLTDGRVSQMFNNPGNLTLEKMIEWACVLGMKISVVAYSDNDPENEHGPVDSEIFRLCWERAGMPHDFHTLKISDVQQVSTTDPALFMMSETDACRIIERSQASNDPRRSRPGHFTKINFNAL